MSDLLDDDGLLDIGDRSKRTDPKAATEEIRRQHRETPAANSALSDWAARLGGGESRPAGPKDSCHVCNGKARFTCQQCERPSCAAHHWVMFGLCHGCATDDQIRTWRNEAKPEEDNWLAGSQA